MSVVGDSAVITRNFVDDFGSEVGRRRCGLRFGGKFLELMGDGRVVGEGSV